MDFALSRIEDMNFQSKYHRDWRNSSHCVHPYTAKMLPQISEFLINKYTSSDCVILDPFCGSGTTLLEANLLGRKAVGFDINPLSILITRAKTTPLSVDETSAAINKLFDNIAHSTQKCSLVFPNIDYWFSEHAKDELYRIKIALESQKKELNADIYNFLLMCFSAIIRKSSNADPYMAKTYKSKRVINRIFTGWSPTPIQYFKDIVVKNLDSLQTTFPNEHRSSSKAFHGDARETSELLIKNKVDKVDTVITSPPYINAQDYFRSYKLELWWLGLATPKEVYALNKKAIGTEYISRANLTEIPRIECKFLDEILLKIWQKGEKGRRKSYVVANYFSSMRTVFSQFEDILDSNAFVCMITGNNTICETEIPTYRILMEIAEEHDFELRKIYRDSIKSRMLFKNRNHNGGIIKEEWITIFKKKTS